MYADLDENGKKRVKYELPKADMHVHISMAWDDGRFIRAVKKGYTTLGPDFLTNRDNRYFANLSEHHFAYEAARKKAQLTPVGLSDIVQTYLQKIAQQGAIYAEISNSFRSGSDFDWQMEAIAAGIDAANHNTGIESRIVVTTLRDHGHEQAEKAAQHLAKVKYRHVTAFGLVGNEEKDDFYNYAKSFKIAYNDAGLGLVPHVAEQYPANAIGFLDALPKEALNQSHTTDPRRTRAGHATTIHLSSDLMNEFAQNNICIESCISSNNRIGLPQRTLNYNIGDIIGSGADRQFAVDRPLSTYFNDKIEQHPITEFIQRGIPICLGSDNPLLQNTNISKEYSQTLRAGVDQKLLLTFTENAIKFANIDNETRQTLMGKVKEYESRIKGNSPPSATSNGYVHASNFLTHPNR